MHELHVRENWERCTETNKKKKEFKFGFFFSHVNWAIDKQHQVFNQKRHIVHTCTLHLPISHLLGHLKSTTFQNTPLLQYLCQISMKTHATGKFSSQEQRFVGAIKQPFASSTHKVGLLKSVSTNNVSFQFARGGKVDFLLWDCKDRQLKKAFLSLLLPL